MSDTAEYTFNELVQMSVDLHTIASDLYLRGLFEVFSVASGYNIQISRVATPEDAELIATMTPWMVQWLRDEDEMPVADLQIV